MSDNKFQNKYRIPSARAQWWDYGNNAAYFITICTANMEHYFGKIIDGKMQLSPVGVIADVFWHEIKKHTDFIELCEFVVMPNHIHGILIIDKPATDVGTDVETGHVETGHALSLPPSPPPPPPPHPQPMEQQPNLTPGQKRFRNQGKNTISSIIGGYKSVVSKHARRLGYDFAWQSRFYDNIIKTDSDYQRIAKYIIDNPIVWEKDRFYSEEQ